MQKTQPLTPSLLDRLLDDNPGVQQEAPITPQKSLRLLHQAVRRDLEALLNTRRRCADYPAQLKELDKSLVNYGIPDFTGVNMSLGSAREELREVIQEVIRTFEPRFKSVKVTLIDNDDEFDRTLRFRIDALLRVKPDPERVVFHSQVEPTTGSVEVKNTDR